MGKPKFFWLGKELKFPFEVSEYEARRKVRSSTKYSANGTAFTVFEHSYDEVKIELDVFSDRDFYHALKAWWAWAKKGKPYGFVLDEDDAVLTALANPAEAGQSEIKVLSTEGITVGGKYKLRSEIEENEEIVKVSGIGEGGTIYLDSPLDYSYEAGDSFRSVDYYPSVISLDGEFPAVEKSFGGFEFKHKFREAK